MTSGPSLILPDPVVLDLRSKGEAVHYLGVGFNTSTPVGMRWTRKVWGALDVATARASHAHGHVPCFYILEKSGATGWFVYPRIHEGTKCWVKEAYRARRVGQGRGQAADVWLAEVQYRADGATRPVLVHNERQRPYYEGSFGDDVTYQLAKKMPAWASRGGVTVERVGAVLVDGGPRWRLDLRADDVWRRPRGGVEGVSGPVVDAGGREAR